VNAIVGAAVPEKIGVMVWNHVGIGELLPELPLQGCLNGKQAGQEIGTSGCSHNSFCSMNWAPRFEVIVALLIVQNSSQASAFQQCGVGSRHTPEGPALELVDARVKFGPRPIFFRAAHSAVNGLR